MSTFRDLLAQAKSAITEVSPAEAEARQYNEAERQRIAQTLEKHSALQTVYNMRRELSVIWERSTASSEQLLKHLQDWCQRAEASGIAPLQEFSMRLRSYA